MKKLALLVAAMALVPVFPAQSQSPAAATPTFEVASVRIAPSSGTTAGRTSVSGDRAVFSNRTLMQLLSFAYGIGCCDLIKGPSWISTERYDIAAKAPDNAPKEQIPPMLQNLLVESFKLVLHHETRELPVYDPIVGKGRLKLQKVENAAVKNDWAVDGEHRLAKSMTMAALAQYVTPMLRSPVIDMTGLQGFYDFPLDLSKEETLRDTAPSIFSMLEDLGLELSPRKMPFDVLVIGGGSKVPVEN